VLLAIGRWCGPAARRSVAVALAAGNIAFGLVGHLHRVATSTRQGNRSRSSSATSPGSRSPGRCSPGTASRWRSRYYWGLTLSLQAMAQPTLDDAFPDPNFFAFWGKHVLLVWGAVYATLTLRQGPDWRGVPAGRACDAAGWSWRCRSTPLLDSNYGYFNGKPSDGTVLDYLGPWPWLRAAEVVIVLVGWALITLPWAGWPDRGTYRGVTHTPRRTGMSGGLGPDPRQDRAATFHPGRSWAQPPRKTRSPAMLDLPPFPPRRNR
jgi:hypothetical protein